jgi:phenylalanyl-tRNA synthetase beta chain
MRVSFNWLKDYVPINLDPEGLANLLTMSGSEVDNIVKTGDELNGIVVSQIVSIAPHPNADKLSLCTVDAGSGTYSIVCGASNIKPGDKAPLALEGTRLPNGITIKTTKIRDQLSQGMLCSETELALGSDKSGIMILPPDMKVGQPLTSSLGLEDSILEISLTPNRPDCLSIIGIAREIAALTRKAVQLPSTHLTETGPEISQLTSVTIEDQDLCPRYTARIISGVTVGPSPFWLRKRLESCGMRSINNVVDVTNYLLLEMGQPLHAFDLELLDQKKIVVKRSTPGNSFTLLDGSESTLPEDALMIYDGSKPIALAGIMGGLNTEVSAQTKTILLESAYFNPSAILRTSKTMGLRTESSQRFEKGVDPQGVTVALNRAAQLIAEFSGGEVSQGYIDNYPTPLSPLPAINLSARGTNTILGTSFTKDEIKQNLKDLTFAVNDIDEDRISATPPSFRVDISESIDLIEEVARLSGYDKISATLPPTTNHLPQKHKNLLLEERAKDSLIQQGYHEIITYSFISPADLNCLSLPDQDYRQRTLKILNPLSEDQSIMRTTLIPGLLTTMKKNINQQNLNLKLFEAGTVFIVQEKGKLPQENKMLSALATGLLQEEAWNTEKRDVDFYDLKGCLENLLKELHITDYSFSPCSDNPFLHPIKALNLMINQEKAGILGETHPQLLDDFQLPQKAYLFEISLPHLRSKFSEHRKFHALSKFPPVSRDIALVLDETIPAQRVYDTIHKFNNKFIEEIKIFDYYKGDSIPKDKKSLAYRITYRAYDHTLTDKEVNALHEELINTLYHELGAEIRK